ncbi:hypothetical protein AAVH_19461 [Aphelenchoides avenae]|nr:hypothetical protein AAVH_19461 [Aphelenchus avenae]
MSPLVKLVLLSLLVQLVVGYFRLHREMSEKEKREALLVLCNNQPRWPVCERFGLGPIYGQGGQEYGGPGPAVDESGPSQVEYQEPEGPAYAKH